MAGGGSIVPTGGVLRVARRNAVGGAPTGSLIAELRARGRVGTAPAVEGRCPAVAGCGNVATRRRGIGCGRPVAHAGLPVVTEDGRLDGGVARHGPHLGLGHPGSIVMVGSGSGGMRLGHTSAARRNRTRVERRDLSRAGRRLTRTGEGRLSGRLGSPSRLVAPSPVVRGTGLAGALRGGGGLGGGNRLAGGLGRPIRPTKSRLGRLIRRAESRLGGLIRRAESGLGGLTRRAESGLGRPIRLAGSELGRPIRPAESGLGGPICLADGGFGGPIRPAESGLGGPICRAAGGLGGPIHLPGARLGRPVHRGTAGLNSTGSAPSDRKLAIAGRRVKASQ